MKDIKIAKSVTLLIFMLLLSASLTMAQDAAVKQVKKDMKKACCTTDMAKTAKHVCTDECKTLGCDVVKAKEAKAMMMSSKHVCTDECKTLGCDVVKAKEAKANMKMKKHICTDKCKNGCTAKS